MMYLEESLKLLNANEQHIFAVCKRLRGVSDKTFLTHFPPSHGTQISFDSSCLRVLSPPALPRKNNNSWSVIEQMLLWQRWLRLKKPAELRNFSANQRFLVDIIHHSKKELPFIPNTVEAHSYINGLAGILGVDDNLSVFDYSVEGAVHQEIPECCEISVYHTLPDVINHKPSKGLNEPFMRCAGENAGRTINKLMPHLKDLSDEQLFSLYDALLEKDWSIREDIPYTSVGVYYPLRRAKSTRTKPYRELLEQSGFSIYERGSDEEVIISTNAPFRSRDQYASDIFSEFLYSFLCENESLIQRLQTRERRLLILQKNAFPDGDNIPFDDLFRVFGQICGIPLTGPIEIRYCPEAKVNTTIVLTSSSEGNHRKDISVFSF